MQQRTWYEAPWAKAITVIAVVWLVSGLVTMLLSALGATLGPFELLFILAFAVAVGVLALRLARRG